MTRRQAFYTNKIIYFIPVRGNSKRVPQKNIIDIDGLPLFVHTIIAADDARQLVAKKYPTIEQHIVVSSESDAVSDAARSRSEVDFFMKRPRELSQDTAQVDELVAFSCRSLHYYFDLGYDPTCTAIVILQPTSFYRDGIHISDSVNLWLHHIKDCSIMSGFVKDKYPYSVRHLDWGEIVVEPIGHDPSIRLGHQWEENDHRVFFENGAIYIGKASTIMAMRTFRYLPILPYIMNEKESLEIDSMADLRKIKAKYE